MNKILVTGSAGFMGSWIADTLVEEGHEVLGLDNLSGGKKSNVKNHKLKEINLLNAKDTRNIILNFNPDIVYHLAACAREVASPFQPRRVGTSVYTLSLNVIESSIEADIDKFIYFSSMSIYGNQEPPFSEDMPRKPMDIYAVAKASIERSIEILHKFHNFDYVIIRPHNLFGERQCLSDPYRNVVGICMNKILRGDPLLMYGEGKSVRALSYIKDSLPSYIKAMDVNNEIINVGGKKPIENWKLVELIKEKMNVPNYPMKYLPQREEVQKAYTTYEKSERLLDYKEKYGLEKGIENMAKWAKKLGPQEWNNEYLPLKGDYLPKPWEDLNE